MDEVEMNFEVAEQVKDDKEDYEVIMADGKRLLKLCYIYGANASGKTTVLRAFEFLRKLLLKPVSDKAIELEFEPFLFRNDPYSHISQFELSFYVEDVRYVYNVSFTRQAIVNEKIVFYQTAKPTELFSRLTDVEKRLVKIQFGSKIKIPVREKDLLEGNTLHNNTVIGAYAKTNVDIPELEILNKWFNTFLLGMITTDQDLTDVTVSLIDQNPLINKWVNTFLNKADYQISEVTISSNYISIPPKDVSPDLIWRHMLNPASIENQSGITQKTDRPKYAVDGGVQRKIDLIHSILGSQFSLPIGQESNGTKRYFGLGGLMYEMTHTSRMLCIDELETSLHPDLVNLFLQLYLVNTERSQLLITTHNTSLMENQDFIRKDALWFSEKNKNGSMSLYSAADFDSTTLRKDASIINAYKAGRLGGKPNLGSPYIIEE
jgi:AAA15 family ATPase/GTPase